MTRRIINIKFFLFFVLILTQSLCAQNLRDIRLSGNSVFSEKDYLNWINFPQGLKLFPGFIDSVKQRISSSLINQGFYNFTFTEATIDTTDEKSFDVLITLKEDSPTIIRETAASFASPADSAQSVSLFTELRGLVLSSTNVEDKINSVLDYYDNHGFPFCKISIESVTFLSDSIPGLHEADLQIKVDPGIKSRIDAIEIEGNKKTRDYVILRELGIEPGSEYSETRISEIPKRLNMLRFFNSVSDPVFYFTPGNKGILKISVEEKETNNFDGIIGYVPKATGGGSGYFTGFVNISFRNLFGTGRAAAVRWQQETSSTQELELRYLEPWLFGYPFNIETSIFQRKQDSTYVQRNIDGKLEFLASQQISASAIISSQSTIPSAASANVLRIFNSSSLAVGFGLKVDTRDDYYSPRSGILFTNTYKYSTKSISATAGLTDTSIKTKNNFQRLELDFSFFYEIFTNQVAALNLHGRELRGDQVEVSDMYMLGGANSLRGYREKQFLGNRIFWSNLEYRYLLPGKSYIFAFFDTGYYLRNEDVLREIPESSGFNMGYGLGMNIETGLGVLAVSFAMAKGDSFGDGKIHFGIINEF